MMNPLRPSDPDMSPLPVELLSLPHSKLYLRRMKEQEDDYEDVDKLGPLPFKQFHVAKDDLNIDNRLIRKPEHKYRCEGSVLCSCFGMLSKFL